MQDRTHKTIVRTATVVAALSLVAVGATAVASIPSSSGTIYGCYGKSTGATRIIDPAKQKCSGSENPISWAQRGPQGLRGPQGIQGKQGVPGTDGTDGKDGAAGGVAGLHVVYKDYGYKPLPIDTGDDFQITCPEGEVALSGDAYMGLYNDIRYIDRQGAAPVQTASIPNGKNDGFYFYFQQPAEGGATQGYVHAQVVCATAADSVPTP